MQDSNLNTTDAFDQLVWPIDGTRKLSLREDQNYKSHDSLRDDNFMKFNIFMKLSHPNVEIKHFQALLQELNSMCTSIIYKHELIAFNVEIKQQTTSN